MIARIARIARIADRWALTRLAIILAAIVGLPALAGAQRLLVPMDDGQSNHLKAYGLTYGAIKAGSRRSGC